MSGLISSLKQAAIPLAGTPSDCDALVERAGDKRFVLLGEASHGTHEFYRERAQITKRLVTEKGFQAVAVEADWPDAYRVDSYVRGQSSDLDATDALAGFKRFPQWMWRNADVLDFVGWLRAHNDGLNDRASRVGFYGLDLYSLHTSMEAVVSYLAQVDPRAAERARRHYACFDHFGADTQRYGLSALLGLSPSCEEAVIQELVQIRQREAEYLRMDGRIAADAFFSAEQNALVVKNAERYYRMVFQGEVSSWNLRDHHMMETLVSLADHLAAPGRPAKIVVWAHNSHLGNAAATQMSDQGEFNLGQLVRQNFRERSLLVGFTTYEGTVTAASSWDSAAERKKVRPALADSYEGLFHEIGVPRFWMDLAPHPEVRLHLQKPRLERAIGVIYRPETERQSHYFRACLPEQFDIVLHFDRTRAVEPLERTATWIDGEVEETYPSGL